MNICIESSVLNHSRRSGLMTYTEGLVNSLCRNDRENRYTLAYYSLTRGPGQMPGPEDNNFDKSVLKVPDREFAGRQPLIDRLMLPLFLKNKRIQVFHRPAGYTMPACNGIFKILTIHDLRTLTIGDQFWTQNIDNYRKTLNALDVCVVVSECTKKDILNHFQVDEGKIKVVYLGADERFKPAAPEAIEGVRHKYKIDRPFLFSVGSVPRKNIDGIIRGFAGSRIKNDFLLVLSCNFEVESYRRLARELGVEEQLLILSQLADDEVVALYSGATSFVFPSLYEGFGLPILEAMQCGAPVITSNISSCPEVAGDAAILVNPQKTAEISEAMDQMCTNEQLRRNIIQKGFERAKRFSWDNFGREMKKIYSLA